MTEQKRITLWDKTLSILNNSIYIIIALFGGSIASAFNYFNHFFEKKYTCSGFQIVLFFFLLFIFMNIIRYFYVRIKTKRIFKKGDKVSFIGHRKMYIVTGYSFLNPDIVRYIDADKKTEYKVTQYVLKFYERPAFIDAHLT